MSIAGELTRAEVESIVWGAIAEILPSAAGAAGAGDKHLRDLGADSIDRVEIIIAVLDRVGADIPMSEFSDLPSVDALVDFLVKVSSR